ncbi:MAG: hypothetical protein ACLQUZ_15275 [Rhizomicrobium sp.]
MRRTPHSLGVRRGIASLANWRANPTVRAATREDYDSALRAVGSDEYKAGYFPYSIIDGWQQLVKDFAYWRANAAGEKFARNDAQRAWFVRDRQTREQLTIRDLGYWSHFVGDASQPLHGED